MFRHLEGQNLSIFTDSLGRARRVQQFCRSQIREGVGGGTEQNRG